MMRLVKGVFEEELVMKEVRFGKREKVGLGGDEGGVVLDVYWMRKEGKDVMVEMEKKEEE